MFKLQDYITGEFVSDKEFKTMDEAIEYDHKRKKQMYEDGEIFNNLVIYKEVCSTNS
jgi:hypothetical protein